MTARLPSSRPPASVATSPTVVPSSISRTPWSRTAPETVTRAVPRVIEPAGGPVPVLAEPGDQGRVGQALDVLDERRASIDAPLRHARRRRGRPGVPAVEVVDRRGRLAGHVADRGRHDAGRTADLVPALVDGPGHRRDRRMVFLADVEDDLVGANRLRRQDRAVDHEVRPARHQDPVLEARGLALGAVRDDDGATVAALGHGSPLAPDREPGPAAAEQAARLEVRDEVAPCASQRKLAQPRDVGTEGLGAAPGGGPARSRWAIWFVVNGCSARRVAIDGAMGPWRPAQPGGLNHMRHRTGGRFPHRGRTKGPGHHLPAAGSLRGSRPGGPGACSKPYGW